MMEVQDTLGERLLKWTHLSPSARWRTALWAVFCLLICLSFAFGFAGLKYGSPWFAAALCSLLADAVLGVNLLLHTRHREYALFQNGIRLRLFWNEDDPGQVQTYRWEEFCGYSVKGRAAKLFRKEIRPLNVFCADNADAAEDIFRRKISS